MENEPAFGLTRRRLLKTLGAGAAAAALGRVPPAAHAAAPHTPAPTGTPLPPVPGDVVAPAVARQVQPFDLADVRLLPGPFQQAMERDQRYLLSLEPDRLLNRFRADAGLTPRRRCTAGGSPWASAGTRSDITFPRVH